MSNGTNNTGTSPGGSTPVAFGGGVGDGIDLDGLTGVTVQSNKVNGNPEYGIAVLATTNSAIGGTKATFGNTTGTNGDGIYVGDNTNVATTNGPSSGNNVAFNTSSNNTVDGILADSMATGNTFTSNVLKTNAQYDAEDQSTGPANTWNLNKCVPAHDSLPAGLC